MSYKVILWPSVAKTIASWDLSNYLLVDVYLFLREVLPSNPSGFLRRDALPFDGMLFEFNIIDPENRLRQHFFTFQVVFSQDEEALIIARGAYYRTDGV